MSVVSRFARDIVRDRWWPATRERWLTARYRLAPRPPPGFRLVLGKSMPRSGHHYLVNLLLAYFDRSFRYCEVYKVPDCCRCTPCVRAYDRRQGNSCFLQKSHDFDLTDNPRLEAPYLIQFRSLIPRIQSRFDVRARRGVCAHTREALASQCVQDLKYTVGFLNKWLRNRQPNVLAISYESLSETPAVALAQAVRFMAGSEADEARIAAAIAAVNARPFPLFVSIRDPRAHPLCDEDLYRKLETQILERCGPDAMRFYFIKPD